MELSIKYVYYVSPIIYSFIRFIPQCFDFIIKGVPRVLFVTVCGPALVEVNSSQQFAGNVAVDVDDVLDEIDKVVLKEVDVENDIAIVLVLVEDADEEIASVVNEVVKIVDILELEVS